MLANGSHDAWPGQLEILTGNPEALQEKRLARLASVLGLDSTIIEAKAFLQSRSQKVQHGTRCVALSADTFTELLEDVGSDNLSNILTGLANDLYLYLFGFGCNKSSERALRSITADQSAYIVQNFAPGSKYSVAEGLPEVAGTLSGTQLGLADPKRDSTFVIRSGPNCKCIVGIQGLIHLMMVINARHVFFLHARDELADVDMPCSSANMEQVFSSALVPIMVLRSAFKGRCWHTPSLFANLVIDDPYLDSHYGWLDLRMLSEQLKRSACCATIAFVPWNYKRTKVSIAQLFSENPQIMSICIHGCDHTWAEFATTDTRSLEALVATAISRMEEHRRRTGLGYDKVMVFPQGLFSSAALKVLRGHGFQAAVSSGSAPIDKDVVPMTLADLLQPAITKYSGMPLFFRRYPEDGELGFRLDAWLGRPVLAVEHHGFFKHGFGPFRELIQMVNRASGNIRWVTLGKACNVYQVKLNADSSLDYRVYCDQTAIANPLAKTAKCRVFKSDPESHLVKEVLFDGCNVDFSVGESETVSEFFMPARAQGIYHIRLAYDKLSGQAGPYPHCKARVWLRRRLSDFRDNVLMTNPLLCRTAKGICRFLRGL